MWMTPQIHMFEDSRGFRIFDIDSSKEHCRRKPRSQLGNLPRWVRVMPQVAAPRAHWLFALPCLPRHVLTGAMCWNSSWLDYVTFFRYFVRVMKKLTNSNTMRVAGTGHVQIGKGFVCWWSLESYKLDIILISVWKWDGIGCRGLVEWDRKGWMEDGMQVNYDELYRT